MKKHVQVLLTGCFLISSCQNGNSFVQEANLANQPNFNIASQPINPKEVIVMDHGLNMPITTFMLDGSWQLQQDVATNLQTGMPDRYKFVMVGPHNQYIRGYCGLFYYGNINQQSFQQTYQEAVQHVIGPENLQNVQFTEMTQNQEAMNTERFAKMRARGQSSGQNVEMVMQDFTGERDGKNFKGRILYNNIWTNDPQYGFGIFQPTSLLFSFAEDFDGMVAVLKDVDKSSTPNPQYSNALEQIHQRVMAQNQQYWDQQNQQLTAAHQKRMADQQAAFSSHQKNMEGLNQIQDAGHASFMNSLKSSGSFSTVGNSSDYTSHDRFIDQTYERQTYTDPYSNTEVNLDGQYDYSYTNGLGDYYRTNDVNFKPESLNGNWQAIDPLKVN